MFASMTVLFQQALTKSESCPICGEQRFKSKDALEWRYPRRTFSYSSLKQSLELLFNCSNIAQVMQAAGGGTIVPPSNPATDITETQIWLKWTTGGNADDEEKTKVILGLNTDGVNPYSSQGIQYSLWPIILCIMNLPKHLRNKDYAIVLIGIVPSRNPKLYGGNLEPNLDTYTALLVDELLNLSSTELYSSYANAPIHVKVSLLVFMMDFQGYAKFFHMSGANSYFACNICLLRSTRKGTKLVLLGHSAENGPDCARRSYTEEVCKYQTFQLCVFKGKQIMGIIYLL